ncbi:hypothetical protein BU17DRAFT_61564 [Hysterangium stoloniferum]|nr:hypothetical protein BU17DRAFT_61564 [Hysterangium stoloniferum]
MSKGCEMLINMVHCRDDCGKHKENVTKDIITDLQYIVQLLNDNPLIVPKLKNFLGDVQALVVKLIFPSYPWYMIMSLMLCEIVVGCGFWIPSAQAQPFKIAGSSTTLELVCLMTISVNNFGCWIKEGINRLDVDTPNSLSALSGCGLDSHDGPSAYNSSSSSSVQMVSHCQSFTPALGNTGCVDVVCSAGVDDDANDGIVLSLSLSPVAWVIQAFFGFITSALPFLLFFLFTG